MGNKIKILRGQSSSLPKLETGELGFTTDDNRVYIGNEDKNICLNVPPDSVLSTTSENAIQNKVVKAALDAKPDTDTTYSAGTGIQLSGTTFSNAGVRRISTGESNGTISVNTNGTTSNVSVYGLGTSAYKSYTDSTYSSAIGTGTSLVTERDVYYGLPKINGVHSYSSDTCIYAPASVGTAGYVLVSKGSGTPVWNAPIHSATYVVTTQAELNRAISSLPEKGGKIILREGSFRIPDSISNKYIIFEGMGQDVTTLIHLYGFTNEITIEFHNMTVNFNNNLSYDSNGKDKASLIFTNCKVSDLGDVEIYNGTGDLTFINCNTDLTGLTVDSDCISGIANAGKVCFIGGRVNLNSGNTYKPGFDCNLIYKCDEFQFADVEIVVSGANRANIVYAPDGIGGFEGCHIYLANSKHSISHYSSNGGVRGAFVGNYVEMYGSYMRFGTITGNIFTQNAAGSSSANKMVLQCETNMMGNNFRGLAVYVDCQNKKCNISYNMVDSGITVGNNASGGYAVANITY